MADLENASVKEKPHRMRRNARDQMIIKVEHHPLPEAFFLARYCPKKAAYFAVVSFQQGQPPLDGFIQVSPIHCFLRVAFAAKPTSN